MACEEEADICFSRTHELLLKAQLLMIDIEELLDSCSSPDASNQRRDRTIQQECRASIEQDGETLVIDGMRFESAASWEDLRRPSSQAAAAAAGGRRGET